MSEPTDPIIVKQNITDIFGLDPSKYNCDCSESSPNRSIWVSLWGITLFIYLLLLINVFVKFIKNDWVITALLIINVIASLVLSYLIYYDSCDCKGNRYSKSYASGYIFISVGLALVFLFFRSRLSVDRLGDLEKRIGKLEIEFEKLDLPKIEGQIKLVETYNSRILQLETENRLKPQDINGNGLP
jgi:hypothetical protein